VRPAGREVMAQTRTTSVFSWIMSRRKFMLGVEDLRAGRDFHPDYDSWSEDQWSYEQGRLWAAVAPRDMPVKIHGKVNPKAVDVYRRHLRDITGAAA
jgi:hypothetical protein